MTIRTRTPMPVRMRAKQFIMFDAMKGLTEAIKEKEQQCYSRNELTVERIEEINQSLCAFQTGDLAKVSYYCHYGKQYRQFSGTVTKIDRYWKELQIEDVTIAFSKIDEIIKIHC